MITRWLRTKLKKLIGLKHHCPKCNVSDIVNVKKVGNWLHLECPSCGHKSVYHRTTF